MRKALRIIAVSAGIVSVVSAVILGCVYLEDLLGYFKKFRSKISDRISDTQYAEEELFGE